MNVGESAYYPEDIVEAIYTAAIGTVLTGTGDGTTITLKADPGNQFKGCVAGAMRFEWRGNSSASAVFPRTTADTGRVHRKHTITLQCRTFAERGNRSIYSRSLAKDMNSLWRQWYNVLEAALEPQSGRQYNIKRVLYPAWGFASSNNTFIELRVDLEMEFYWGTK